MEGLSALRGRLYEWYGFRHSGPGSVRVALAAETGAVRGHIVTQSLSFAARMPSSR
jgi:hypothetical protein